MFSRKIYKFYSNFSQEQNQTVKNEEQPQILQNGTTTEIRNENIRVEVQNSQANISESNQSYVSLQMKYFASFIFFFCFQNRKSINMLLLVMDLSMVFSQNWIIVRKSKTISIQMLDSSPALHMILFQFQLTARSVQFIAKENNWSQAHYNFYPLIS